MLDQLIALMFIGWIEPVALSGEPAYPWWESELLWALTKHTYEHAQPEPGCAACQRQERLSLYLGKGNIDV